MTTWDPAGPLPTGTAVLEASAGTGKTYAIAALAARYLAEGVVSADRLAVISFSRMASAGGPMNTSPAAWHAAANSALSLRNP